MYCKKKIMKIKSQDTLEENKTKNKNNNKRIQSNF